MGPRVLVIDLKRAQSITFSSPYVRIEGTHLVPEGERFATSADIDAAAGRVAVGRGTAYGLYLTRTVAHAGLGATREMR